MLYIIKQEAFPYKIVKRYKRLSSVNKYLGIKIDPSRVEAIQSDTWIGSRTALSEGNSGLTVHIKWN
jgi:hypothetical protein